MIIDTTIVTIIQTTIVSASKSYPKCMDLIHAYTTQFWLAEHLRVTAKKDKTLEQLEKLIGIMD